MKRTKLLVTVAVASLALTMTSCSTSRKTLSKNAVAFPGMTVSRADYKLSKDVSSTVKVNETSLFARHLSFVKTEGEEKNVVRQGYVKGLKLTKSAELAVYKLLEKNPTFDYLTNIRVKEEFNKKWLFLFTKRTSQVTVTAKGITLKTQK